MNKVRTLAVIAARGGSKGIPGKNLRKLAGQPLVARAVRTALAARGVDRVLVSSDSDAILAAARVHPSVICLKRPAELARDETPMMPVYRHAIEAYEREAGFRITHLVGLQATSPLSLPSDVEGTLRTALKTKADFVVTVKVASENPYFVQVERRRNGWFEQAKKSLRTRRQDVPVVYTLNGAVDAAPRDVVFRINHVYDARKLAVYEMPQERSIDLDTETDFVIAEALMRLRRSRR